MLQDIFGGLDSFADRAKLFSWLFGVLSGFLAWRRTDTPKNDTDRNAVIASLRHDRLGTSYKAKLTRALDALDARLSKAERANDAAPGHRATAWSYGLLNLSLILALAYPFGGLLMNWGLFNNGALGGQVVIPEAERLARAAPLCGLALAVGLQTYSLRLQDQAKLVLGLVSLGLALAVAFAVPSAVAFAFAVAVAFAGAVAVAFAGAVAGAVVVAGAGAVTGAFAVAFAFAFTVEWIGARLNVRTLSLTLLVLLGLVAVWFAARIGFGAVRGKSIILFIAALPLLNGLADFASTGLTRYLLRRSLDTSGRWEAASDLIGGVAIYLALGCAIIAFIAWTPLINGTHLANLPRIFQDLADPATRGQYWWLLLMLASTLLPTALHLLLFLITLIRHIPARLRHWLANEFEQAAKIDSNLRGRRAALALSALNAFAAVASLWLMTELWLSVSPLAIDGSVAVFRAFALAIGAIA